MVDCQFFVIEANFGNCDALTQLGSAAIRGRRLVLDVQAEQGLGPWSTEVCEAKL